LRLLIGERRVATFRYFGQIWAGDDFAIGVDRSATSIVIRYRNGDVETYSGSFGYTGDAVTSGVGTGYTLSNKGAAILTIDGLNVPAASLYSALVNNDTAKFISLIFGGNDEMWGSGFGEELTGFEGADTLIALDGNDSVRGGEGNDDINGNVGQDMVWGENGADWVRGGKDNDTLYGGNGDDPHINGNIGDDLAFGGAGNDTLYGGQDQDTLRGEAGNDLLSGDLGADILYGDAGADRFVLRAGSGTDWVADFNAGFGDRIQLSPGATYTVTSSSGQVMISLGGGDQIGLAGIADATFSSSWIVFG
jgi:Ca2+-binding RTX toxin-like protein